MAKIIEVNENKAMEIMGSIYEYLTKDDAEVGNSPFMKKLLRQVLSSREVLINGDEMGFAKIHEEVIDEATKSVKTEIIFLNINEENGEDIVNFQFVLGVTSTVNNLNSKKVKYRNFKDIYCRMVSPRDIALYVSALEFSEKFKKYNHLLHMQVNLRDKDWKLLGTL